jgi:PAS domain S-box-containing protein
LIPLAIPFAPPFDADPAQPGASRRRRLRDALETARAILENSQALICAIDDDGFVQRANGNLEAVLGYTPDEVIGRPLADFVHPEDLEQTLAMGDRLAEAAPQVLTSRYRHRSGVYVPIEWTAVRSANGDAVFAIGRDMSQIQAAEDRLRQSQKMEAIGRLAGGVAHDFNNLLTVVIGGAEQLTEALADRPDLQVVARQTLEAAERGAELVSRLMAFSRSRPLAPQIVDCRAFLESVAEILRRIIRKEIAIETAIAGASLHCQADLSQLTSAVLNLALNARDAMPCGGRIRISASRRVGADGETPMVVIAVEDTGAGMSPEVAARIFDPFYTTKLETGGTGLGLSMVYGFARQSGGSVEVESEPGKGARISLALPAAETPAAAPAPAPAAPVTASGLKVLVVDDDDLVRVQVGRHLEALGCEVTACATGAAALEAIAAEPAFDLLFTDISMPGGMDGEELARRARALRPELRILFSSGFADKALVDAAKACPRSTFLLKPYRRTELARRIEELMGAPEDGGVHAP